MRNQHIGGFEAMNQREKQDTQTDIEGLANEGDKGQGDRVDSYSSIAEDQWKLERNHLANTLELIQSNIDYYGEELQKITTETKELYDNYRSNNPELHNDLVIGLDMKSQIARFLHKNEMALKKPYFGRIDYIEDGESFQLYIGKNGIRKNRVEGLIIDWRAPISSVYYESDMGEGQYHTPLGEVVPIQVEKKRTYEIQNGVLEDFFDSDVITNDDFLTKYLSKNKEVVLGEIIATIQKEQNQIIRDTPFHTVIVQGVAGSGKTTVAMHRISHILYNYKEKLRPDEFFIIGSNKMLLNYITGVLPNLDVYNVNQMTLQEFILLHLDKDFDVNKGKYTIVDSFLKLEDNSQDIRKTQLKRYKGTLDYIKSLELFLKKYERDMIAAKPVIYKNQVLYTEKEILYYLDFFQDKPLQEKIDLLNKQVIYRVTSIGEVDQLRKDQIKAETKKYKNYFGNRSAKIKLMEIYEEFSTHLLEDPVYYEKMNLNVPDSSVLDLLKQELQQKRIDLYDLAMLLRIKKQLRMTKDFAFVSHIVIDEAQDFGVMVFHLLRQLFPTCTYTIMGDVSQNIHYNTGMNDWEELKNEVFNPVKDKFYLLAKSYRNTVEISNYASNVLRKCSFKTYEIQPIIRHGEEVEVKKLDSIDELVTVALHRIQKIKDGGYDTIAIICRTVEETRKVQGLLSEHMELQEIPEDMEDMSFVNGIMVLPIHMTKGLEFDGVILWNPVEENYQETDGDAKLLYVAITRAMHELHILYTGNLSKLLL